MKIFEEICVWIGLSAIFIGMLASAIGLLFSMHRPWWVYVPIAGLISIILGVGFLWIAFKCFQSQSANEAEDRIRQDMM